MPRTLATGNHAAGYTLARAGEANRTARGTVSGIYPITPQTEIVEYLSGFEFSKGRVIPVESEHSAMGVCIGAAQDGARSFTASSANGLAYMVENVFTAGYYRLPIVMIAVNRTLGPPWNIWVDQGDSLMLRDAAWLQFYCASHQDLVDTILLAFRVAEDSRVLLPALIAIDGFLVSHTQSVVELPEQAQVDAFLPTLDLPHRLRYEHPKTVGGMTWPQTTEFQRHGVAAAMERVPQILDQAIAEFTDVFGRTPRGPYPCDHCEDVDIMLVACNTLSRTLREVVHERRAAGERIGLLELRMFRPLDRTAIRGALGQADRIGIIDRNYSAGLGGVFGAEVTACLNGHSNALIQNYMVGLGGGDVQPKHLNEIIDDLLAREHAGDPAWKEVAV
jgi:pyruvate/2-oxoacid:ferredoxin oxidoreductase alpha subunit